MSEIQLTELSSARPRPVSTSPTVAILQTLAMAEGLARSTQFRATFEAAVQSISSHRWNIAVADRYLHELILQPVPGRALKAFSKELRLNREQTSSLLGTTAKTVRAREHSNALPPSDIERMARFVRALMAASATFEDEDYAREWLFAPCGALGGQVPFELLVTGDGEHLVIDELGRIEHGLPV